MCIVLLVFNNKHFQNNRYVILRLIIIISIILSPNYINIITNDWNRKGPLLRRKITSINRMKAIQKSLLWITLMIQNQITSSYTFIWGESLLILCNHSKHSTYGNNCFFLSIQYEILHKSFRYVQLIQYIER